MRFTGRFIAVLLVALIFIAVRPVRAAGTVRIDAQENGAAQNNASPSLVPSAQVTVTPAPPASSFALLPTPARGPKNPATVGQSDLMVAMLQGAVLTLIVFAVLGLYVAVRGLFRDR